MHIDDDEGEIVFSTGKRLECMGSIGLQVGGFESDNPEVTYGSDGAIYDERHDEFGVEDDYRMTNAEAVELADYMIARWTEHKQRHTKEPK